MEYQLPAANLLAYHDRIKDRAFGVETDIDIVAFVKTWFRKKCQKTSNKSCLWILSSAGITMESRVSGLVSGVAIGLLMTAESLGLES